VLKLFARLRSRVEDLLGDDIFALIARGAGAVFGIQVASFLLRYLVHLGLARWMGASEYGMYAFVLSMTAILAIAAKLGFPTAVLRFVSEYREESDWERLRGIVQGTWAITLAVGLAVAAAAYAVVEGLHRFGYIDHPLPLQIGVWLIPLLGLVTLQKETIRGLERMVLAYAPSYIGRRVLVLLSVGGTYLWFGSVDSPTALLLTAGVLVVIVGGQALAGWRQLPPSAREASPTYETQTWFRVAWPLLLVASFNVLLNQTDIFLLGVLRTSEEVGFYNVALKTGTIVTFLLTGINAIAAPRIARIYRNGDMDRMQRLVSMVAHLSFWPSLLGSMVLIAISAPFLRLFGPEFTAGQAALIILVIGKLINAGAGSVGYLMNMTGHQDESARVFAWSAGANVLFNLALIPFFGIEGAAVATASTAALWNVWLCILVKRRMGITSHVLTGSWM
jgi:O-antigen/teichoic acid export membrane protein